MANYKLSNEAKEDLIRIHHLGARKFGISQADKYFNSFFDYFDIIAQRPLSFESVDYIKKGYRRCVCGSDSIYFKISDDMVEIMAIVGMQDLGQIISLSKFNFPFQNNFPA
jgi:toxin ParE1/3/4